MLSAAVPTQRPVAPEVSTHLISVTGLTESSSSGKLIIIIIIVAFHMSFPSLFYFFRCIENPMDCIVTPLCPSVSKTKSLCPSFFTSQELLK